MRSKTTSFWMAVVVASTTLFLMQKYAPTEIKPLTSHLLSYPNNVPTILSLEGGYPRIQLRPTTRRSTASKLFSTPLIAPVGICKFGAEDCAEIAKIQKPTTPPKTTIKKIQDEVYEEQNGNEEFRYGYQVAATQTYVSQENGKTCNDGGGTISGTYCAPNGERYNVNVATTNQAAANYNAAVVDKINKLTPDEVIEAASQTNPNIASSCTDAACQQQTLDKALELVASSALVAEKNNDVQNVKESYLSNQKALDYINLTQEELQKKYGSTDIATLLPTLPASTLKDIEAERLRQQAIIASAKTETTESEVDGKTVYTMTTTYTDPDTGKVLDTQTISYTAEASTTKEKVDNGFITHDTVIFRDTKTGDIVDAQTTSYILKSTTKTYKTAGRASGGTVENTSVTTTTATDANTGEVIQTTRTYAETTQNSPTITLIQNTTTPSTDGSGTATTSITRSSIANPNYVAPASPTSTQLNTFNKKLGETCTSNTDCSTGLCGRASVVVKDATCQVNPNQNSPITASPESCPANTSLSCRGTACACLTQSQISNLEQLELASAGNLPALAATIPQDYSYKNDTNGIYNYAGANGNLALNKLLTYADTGWSVIPSWDRYKNSFSPDNVKRQWQAMNYSSLEDCQKNLPTTFQNGTINGPFLCNDVIYSQEQFISSVDLGTDLTSIGAAVTGIPGALKAGGNILLNASLNSAVTGVKYTLGQSAMTALQAALPTIGTFGAISTANQTGNTAVSCLDGSDTCARDLGYTTLSWLNLGSMQYISNAMASGVASQIRNAQIVNTTLTVANAGTDVAIANESCFGENKTTAGCLASAGVIAFDIAGGFFDLKTGQFIFQKVPDLNVNSAALASLASNPVPPPTKNALDPIIDTTAKAAVPAVPNITVLKNGDVNNPLILREVTIEGVNTARIDATAIADPTLRSRAALTNSLLDEFAKDIGYQPYPAQVAELLSGKTVMQLKYPDGHALAGQPIAGKTDIIARLASVGEPRSVILTKGTTEAMDYINTQMLGPGGRSFYQSQGATGIFVHNELGFLEIDFTKGSFNPNTARVMSADEVSTLLKRNLDLPDESRLVFVADRPQAAWTRLSDNSSGLVMKDLLTTNTYGSALIIADEISEDIKGVFAVSGAGIPLGDLTDASLLGGVKSGDQAINMFKQAVDESPTHQQFTSARSVELNSGTGVAGSLQNLGDGNFIPVDKKVYGNTLADLVDQSLKKYSHRISKLGQDLADLTPALRSGDPAAIKNFEALLADAPPSSLLTDITFRKSSIQSDYNMLARVPGSDFGIEGNDLVLRKATATTGEKLSGPTDLLAFYHRGYDMTQAYNAHMIEKIDINKPITRVELADISISPQGSKISVTEFYQEMQTAGHKVMGLDATPQEAISALYLKDTPIETKITPAHLATDANRSGLVDQFVDRRASQFNNNASAVVLAKTNSDMNADLLALVKKSQEKGVGYTEVIVAQYKKQPNGLEAEEYLAYPVKPDGEIDFSKRRNLGDAQGWNAAIQSKLSGDKPQELLIVYMGRERAADLKITANHDKIRWSLLFETSGGELPTEVSFEQMWRRNRIFNTDYSKSMDFDLYLTTTRTDLTPDNIQTAYFRENLNTKLANDRFTDALDGIAKSPARALEQIKALSNEKMSFLARIRFNRLVKQLEQEVGTFENILRTGLSPDLLTGDDLYRELYARASRSNARILGMAEQVGKVLSNGDLSALKQQLRAVDSFPEYATFRAELDNPTLEFTAPESFGPADLLMAYAKNNSTNTGAAPQFRATNERYIAPTTPNTATTPRSAQTNPDSSGPLDLNSYLTQALANNRNNFTAIPTLNGRPLNNLINQPSFASLAFRLTNNTAIAITREEDGQLYYSEDVNGQLSQVKISDFNEVIKRLPNPASIVNIQLNEQDLSSSALTLNTSPTNSLTLTTQKMLSTVIETIAGTILPTSSSYSEVITDQDGNQYGIPKNTTKRQGIATGTVVQGVNLKTNEKVAIKRPHDKDLASRELLLQYEEKINHEADVLSRLDHPNIPKLLAKTTLSEGYTVLIMPWIDGESLEEEIARGTLNIDEIESRFSPIASAIDYAHSMGIAHEDIMVFSNIRQNMLLDWGIATTHDLSTNTVPTEYTDDNRQLAIAIFASITGKVVDRNILPSTNEVLQAQLDQTGLNQLDELFINIMNRRATYLSAIDLIRDIKTISTLSTNNISKELNIDTETAAKITRGIDALENQESVDIDQNYNLSILNKKYGGRAAKIYVLLDRQSGNRYILKKSGILVYGTMTVDNAREEDNFSKLTKEAQESGLINPIIYNSPDNEFYLTPFIEGVEGSDLTSALTPQELADLSAKLIVDLAKVNVSLTDVVFSSGHNVMLVTENGVKKLVLFDHGSYLRNDSNPEIIITETIKDNLFNIEIVSSFTDLTLLDSVLTPDILILSNLAKYLDEYTTVSTISTLAIDVDNINNNTPSLPSWVEEDVNIAVITPAWILDRWISIVNTLVDFYKNDQILLHNVIKEVGGGEVTLTKEEVVNIKLNLIKILENIKAEVDPNSISGSRNTFIAPIRPLQIAGARLAGYLLAINPTASTISRIPLARGELITSRSDIKSFVETPLINAVETLWDKNIQTGDSNAYVDPEIGSGRAWIGIERDSLSEENLKIALSIQGVSNDNPKRVFFYYPITKDTPVQEVSDWAMSIANELRPQPFIWSDAIIDIEKLRKSFNLNSEAVEENIEIAGWYKHTDGRVFASKEIADKYLESEKRSAKNSTSQPLMLTAGTRIAGLLLASNPTKSTPSTDTKSLIQPTQSLSQRLMASTLKTVLSVLDAPQDDKPASLITDAEEAESQAKLSSDKISQAPMLNSQTIEKILNTDNINLTFTTFETDEGYVREFTVTGGQLYYSGNLESPHPINLEEALLLLPDPADVAKVELNGQEVTMTYFLPKPTASDYSRFTDDLSIAITSLISGSKIIHAPTSKYIHVSERYTPHNIDLREVFTSTGFSKAIDPDISFLYIETTGDESNPLTLALPPETPKQSLLTINNVTKTIEQWLFDTRSDYYIKLSPNDTVRYGNHELVVRPSTGNSTLGHTKVLDQTKDLHARLTYLEELRTWATSTDPDIGSVNRFNRAIRYAAYKQAVKEFEETVQQRYQDLDTLHKAIFSYIIENHDNREGILNFTLEQAQKLSFTHAEINNILYAINGYVLQHERVSELRTRYGDSKDKIKEMWQAAFGFEPQGEIQIHYSYNTINLIPTNLTDFGRAYHVGDTTTKNVEPTTADIDNVIKTVGGFHKNNGTRIANTENIFNVVRDDETLAEVITHEDQHGLFKNLEMVFLPSRKNATLATKQEALNIELTRRSGLLDISTTTYNNLAQINSLNLTETERLRIEKANLSQTAIYLTRVVNNDIEEIIFYDARPRPKLGIIQSLTYAGTEGKAIVFRGQGISDLSNKLIEYAYDERIDAEADVANEILAQITGRVAIGVPLPEIKAEVAKSLRSHLYAYFVGADKSSTTFNTHDNQPGWNQFRRTITQRYYTAKAQEDATANALVAYETLILKGWSHSSASFLLQSTRLTNWLSVANRASVHIETNSTPRDIDYSLDFSIYPNSISNNIETLKVKNAQELRDIIDDRLNNNTISITRKDGSIESYAAPLRSLTIQYYDAYGNTKFATYTSAPTLLADIIDKADITEIFTYNNRDIDLSHPIEILYKLNGKDQYESINVNDAWEIEPSINEFKDEILDSDPEIETKNLPIPLYIRFTNSLGLKEVYYPFGRTTYTSNNPASTTTSPMTNSSLSNSSSITMISNKSVNLQPIVGKRQLITPPIHTRSTTINHTSNGEFIINIFEKNSYEVPNFGAFIVSSINSDDNTIVIRKESTKKYETISIANISEIISKNGISVYSIPARTNGLAFAYYIDEAFNTGLFNPDLFKAIKNSYKIFGIITPDNTLFWYSDTENQRWGHDQLASTADLFGKSEIISTIQNAPDSNSWIVSTTKTLAIHIIDYLLNQGVSSDVHIDFTYNGGSYKGTIKNAKEHFNVLNNKSTTSDVASTFEQHLAKWDQIEKDVIKPIQEEIEKPEILAQRQEKYLEKLFSLINQMTKSPSKSTSNNILDQLRDLGYPYVGEFGEWINIGDNVGKANGYDSSKPYWTDAAKWVANQYGDLVSGYASGNLLIELKKAQLSQIKLSRQNELKQLTEQFGQPMANLIRTHEDMQSRLPRLSKGQYSAVNEWRKKNSGKYFLLKRTYPKEPLEGVNRARFGLDFRVNGLDPTNTTLDEGSALLLSRWVQSHADEIDWWPIAVQHSTIPEKRPHFDPLVSTTEQSTNQFAEFGDAEMYLRVPAEKLIPYSILAQERINQLSREISSIEFSSDEAKKSEKYKDLNETRSRLLRNVSEYEFMVIGNIDMSEITSYTGGCSVCSVEAGKVAQAGGEAIRNQDIMVARQAIKIANSHSYERPDLQHMVNAFAYTSMGIVSNQRAYFNLALRELNNAEKKFNSYEQTGQLLGGNTSIDLSSVDLSSIDPRLIALLSNLPENGSVAAQSPDQVRNTLQNARDYLKELGADKNNLSSLNPLMLQEITRRNVSRLLGDLKYLFGNNEESNIEEQIDNSTQLGFRLNFPGSDALARLVDNAILLTKNPLSRVGINFNYESIYSTEPIVLTETESPSPMPNPVNQIFDTSEIEQNFGVNALPNLFSAGQNFGKMFSNIGGKFSLNKNFLVVQVQLRQAREDKIFSLSPEIKSILRHAITNGNADVASLYYITSTLRYPALSGLKENLINDRVPQWLNMGVPDINTLLETVHIVNEAHPLLTQSFLDKYIPEWLTAGYSPEQIYNIAVALSRLPSADIPGIANEIRYWHDLPSHYFNSGYITDTEISTIISQLATKPSLIQYIAPSIRYYRLTDSSDHHHNLVELLQRYPILLPQIHTYLPTWLADDNRIDAIKSYLVRIEQNPQQLALAPYFNTPNIRDQEAIVIEALMSKPELIPEIVPHIAEWSKISVKYDGKNTIVNIISALQAATPVRRARYLSLLPNLISAFTQVNNDQYTNEYKNIGQLLHHLNSLNDSEYDVVLPHITDWIKAGFIDYSYSNFAILIDSFLKIPIEHQNEASGVIITLLSSDKYKYPNILGPILTNLYNNRSYLNTLLNLLKEMDKDPHNYSMDFDLLTRVLNQRPTHIPTLTPHIISWYSQGISYNNILGLVKLFVRFPELPIEKTIELALAQAKAGKVDELDIISNNELLSLVTPEYRKYLELYQNNFSLRALFNTTDGYQYYQKNLSDLTDIDQIYARILYDSYTTNSNIKSVYDSMLDNLNTNQGLIMENLPQEARNFWDIYKKIAYFRSLDNPAEFYRSYLKDISIDQNKVIATFLTSVDDKQNLSQAWQLLSSNLTDEIINLLPKGLSTLFEYAESRSELEALININQYINANNKDTLNPETYQNYVMYLLSRRSPIPTENSSPNNPPELRIFSQLYPSIWFNFESIDDINNLLILREHFISNTESSIDISPTLQKMLDGINILDRSRDDIGLTIAYLTSWIYSGTIDQRLITPISLMGWRIYVQTHNEVLISSTQDFINLLSRINDQAQQQLRDLDDESLQLPQNYRVSIGTEIEVQKNGLQRTGLFSLNDYIKLKQLINARKSTGSASISIIDRQISELRKQLESSLEKSITQYRSQVAQLDELNVGKGGDGTHEFANQPVPDYNLLVWELSELEQLGFLSLNPQILQWIGERGIHITISGETGIKLDENVTLLQNSLLATGYANSPLSGQGGIQDAEEKSETTVGIDGQAVSTVYKIARDLFIRTRESIKDIFTDFKVEGVEFRVNSISSLLTLNKTLKAYNRLSIPLMVFQRNMYKIDVNKLMETMTDFSDDPSLLETILDDDSNEFLLSATIDPLSQDLYAVSPLDRKLILIWAYYRTQSILGFQQYQISGILPSPLEAPTSKQLVVLDGELGQVFKTTEEGSSRLLDDAFASYHEAPPKDSLPWFMQKLVDETITAVEASFESNGQSAVSVETSTQRAVLPLLSTGFAWSANASISVQNTVLTALQNPVNPFFALLPDLPLLIHQVNIWFSNLHLLKDLVVDNVILPARDATIYFFRNVNPNQGGFAGSAGMLRLPIFTRPLTPTTPSEPTSLPATLGSSGRLLHPVAGLDDILPIEPVTSTKAGPHITMLRNLSRRPSSLSSELGYDFTLPATNLVITAHDKISDVLIANQTGQSVLTANEGGAGIGGIRGQHSETITLKATNLPRDARFNSDRMDLGQATLMLKAQIDSIAYLANQIAREQMVTTQTYDPEGNPQYELSTVNSNLYPPSSRSIRFTYPVTDSNNQNNPVWYFEDMTIQEASRLTQSQLLNLTKIMSGEFEPDDRYLKEYSHKVVEEWFSYNSNKDDIPPIAAIGYVETNPSGNVNESHPIQMFDHRINIRLATYFTKTINEKMGPVTGMVANEIKLISPHSLNGLPVKNTVNNLVNRLDFLGFDFETPKVHQLETVTIPFSSGTVSFVALTNSTYIDEADPHTNNQIKPSTNLLRLLNIYGVETHITVVPALQNLWQDVRSRLANSENVKPPNLLPHLMSAANLYDRGNPTTIYHPVAISGLSNTIQMAGVTQGMANAPLSRAVFGETTLSANDFQRELNFNSALLLEQSKNSHKDLGATTPDYFLQALKANAPGMQQLSSFILSDFAGTINAPIQVSYLQRLSDTSSALPINISTFKTATTAQTRVGIGVIDNNISLVNTGDIYTLGKTITQMLSSTKYPAIRQYFVANLSPSFFKDTLDPRSPLYKRVMRILKGQEQINMDDPILKQTSNETNRQILIILGSSDPVATFQYLYATTYINLKEVEATKKVVEIFSQAIYTVVEEDSRYSALMRELYTQNTKIMSLEYIRNLYQTVLYFNHMATTPTTTADDLLLTLQAQQETEQQLTDIFKTQDESRHENR